MPNKFIYKDMADNTAYKVVGISGSLRVDSTNTALLRCAAELAPKNRILQINIIDYKGVPIYNQDIKDSSGIPQKVKDIAQ